MDKYDEFDDSYGAAAQPAPLSRAELIQQQKQQSMARQLDATQRCVASIWDSEAVGIATAEELMHQGEQLDNIDRKTDKINADTKIAQQHLNGIKSIFGGLKNWWNGEGKTTAATPTESTSRSSALQAVTSNRSQDRDTFDGGVHPALRIRSDDSSNPFYDNDVQTFDSKSGSGYGASSSSGYGSQSKMSSAGSATRVNQQATSGRSSEWNQYEASLDKNLDCMSSGLSNLKLLAKGLNEEIETQNDQIDRIMPKVDRADTKIRDQNRQMRTILGTKEKK